MKSVSEQSKPQTRWDSMYQKFLDDFQSNPESYFIHESPYLHSPFHDDIIGLLGKLENKNVIEFGCGHGKYSVHLATHGAKVTGIDVGPHLVTVCETLARHNGVQCNFINGSITEQLPLEEGSQDVVIGIGILHHLSQKDLIISVNEAHRILRSGGTAIFIEPVENSIVFNFLQNLIPVGRKKQGSYRPSMLSRKAWKEYIKAMDDRDLTNKELQLAGAKFDKIIIRPYGFFIRFHRIFKLFNIKMVLNKIDRFMFKILPFMGRFCQMVLVEYHKAARGRNQKELPLR